MFTTWYEQKPFSGYEEQWAKAKAQYLAHADIPRVEAEIIGQISAFESRETRVTSSKAPPEHQQVRTSSGKFGKGNAGWFQAWLTGAIIMGPYHVYKCVEKFPIVTSTTTDVEVKAFGASSSAAAYGGYYRFIGHGERVALRNEVDHYFTPDSPLLGALKAKTMAGLAGPSVDPTEMWTALVADANAAAFDLATELAESAQTAEYLKGLLPRVKDSLAGLYRAYKGMRNPKRELARFRKFAKKKGKGFKPSQVPDPLKKAAGYWMEYNYAVRPLMYSVADATKAIAQTGRNAYQSKRQRRIHSDRHRHEEGDYVCEVDLEITYRVMARQSIDLDRVTSKVSLWIPSAAWEIVPYSFVVDWFVGIGDYLAALRPFYGNQRVFSSSVKTERTIRVFRRESDDSNSQTPTPPKPPYSQRVWSGITHRIYTPGEGLMYEERLDSYSRAAPVSPCLGIRVRTNLNHQRAVSAAALSYQQLSRLR